MSVSIIHLKGEFGECSKSSPLYTVLRPSCHLCATIKWLGRSVVAGTQKVLFLCNCCRTTLVPSLNNQSCCSGTTGRAKKAGWRQNHCHGGPSVAVVAEWWHSGRHSHRSMDAIGRPNEAQWWNKEGRRVAQIDAQCSHFLLADQWPTTVHPFCDQGNVCAFILPPLSDRWATDLLGDLCATVLNMLKNSRRPWRPWRCLNVLCATLERPRQPFGLPSAFNGDLASLWSHKGGTKVAAHAFLPLLHHVAPLNDGNCRLTMHVVKGRCGRGALIQTFNIDVLQCSKSTRLRTSLTIMMLLLTPMIGVSAWHGGYDDTRSPWLHTSHDCLTPGVCRQIKPVTMAKLMSFPAKIHTIML